MNQEIYDAVCEIVADELDVELKDIDPDARLKSDLNADSLSIVQIQLMIEEKFNIEIDDGDLEMDVTCRQIATNLEHYLAKA